MLSYTSPLEGAKYQGLANLPRLWPDCWIRSREKMVSLLAFFPLRVPELVAIVYRKKGLIRPLMSTLPSF